MIYILATVQANNQMSFVNSTHYAWIAHTHEFIVKLLILHKNIGVNDVSQNTYA